MLLLGKHQLDSVSLLGGTEAGRAVVSDDWQIVFGTEVFEQGFSAGNQRSNYTQVTGVNCIVGLHGPEAAVMETAHDEALGQVVQMLPHGDDVVAFSSGAVVNHASLHSGAKTANGVLLHAFFGPLHDGIRLNPIRNIEALHVFGQRLGLVLVDLRINRDAAKLKFDWRHLFEVSQNVDKCERVLASTDGNEHPVSILDHLKVPDGSTDL